MIDKKIIQKITQAVLLLVIVIYIITGFGITQFRIVEYLTLGLLTKSLAFKIHSSLIIPLIVFLVLHVYFGIRQRKNQD